MSSNQIKRSKTQKASSQIWTQVTHCISYDDNWYVKYISQE